jgi:hypothetical protein
LRPEDEDEAAERRLSRSGAWHSRPAPRIQSTSKRLLSIRSSAGTSTSSTSSTRNGRGRTLDRIFLTSSEQAARHAAAWKAFLQGNRFWPRSWDVLAPHYAIAVDALADERYEHEDVSFLDLTGQLLGHVFSACLYDLIELDDESRLGRFFSRAPLKLRRSFFELIGTDLAGDDEVSEQMQAKLQRLWSGGVSGCS